MTKIARLNNAFLILVSSLVIFSCSTPKEDSSLMVSSHLKNLDPDKVDWKAKDAAYWQSVLTPEQYQVCRQAGTEPRFSGKYCLAHRPGTFLCACCGLQLFSGDKKFDSGTGWPSFFEAAKPGIIDYVEDDTLGMKRTEVRCARCGAHLGHVFDDGPPPTGKRYCINSICLIHQDDLDNGQVQGQPREGK